ncbi:MAG: ABC transporter ATP-binding protein [Candidatus Kapaibacteriota bacterium]
MNKIETKNLNKIYNTNNVEYHILKDINIDIQENEFVSIIGPSGAGKSTLLYMIGTLDIPSSGEILYFNQKSTLNLEKLKQKDLNNFRNKNLGFIFQFHHLLPEFSVFENIMMPVYLGNENLKEAEQRAISLMEYAGIIELKDKMPSQISGGEQQRVAIIRALINNPDLILADEPTGNLDSENSKIILNMLKKIQRDFNVTIIVATHSDYIANASDRIIKIADGRVV